MIIFSCAEIKICERKQTENNIKAGDVIILIGRGPIGCGMEETYQITSALKYLSFGKEVALVTDARFSGVSTGACIGHVGPEAALGGPIALIEDGDEIIVDLNVNELNCTPLKDQATFESRMAAWQKVVEANEGMHPSIGKADTRLLNRMRRSAVSAVYGAGMHSDRVIWVNKPRKAENTGFVPRNKYREVNAAE